MSGAERESYDIDFYAWAMKSAELLRQRRWSELDVNNLAEEIEALGRSEKRELASRMAVLLLHLLKYAYQPELRCGSWRGSIAEQRHRIASLLEDSPSLRSTLTDIVKREYSNARHKALLETGLAVLPESCPFTPERIMDPDFWPD